MKRYILGLAGASALAIGLQAGTALAQDCSVNVGTLYPTSVDWGRPIAETALWVVAKDHVDLATVDAASLIDHHTPTARTLVPLVSPTRAELRNLSPGQTS